MQTQFLEQNWNCIPLPQEKADHYIRESLSLLHPLIFFLSQGVSPYVDEEPN